jgi:uncharacterized protein YlxP (DUF503 family)
MPIGLLTLDLYFPGCRSLKEKRSRLKPLITRLHKEFNISVSEVDHQDIWQSATVACALVSSDHNHIQRSLYRIIKWIDSNWPDVSIVDDHIELI